MTNIIKIAQLIVVLISFLSFPAVGCSDLLKGDINSSYNPKPSTDDIVIGMPCGLKMVFRKIYVPGKGFWGNEQRVVEFGRSGGGIFEKPQKITVSGSFPDNNNNWYYLIGKYEISIAQYIALRGTENLEKVVEPSSPLLKQTNLDRKIIHTEIAKPISSFDFIEFHALVDTFNRWLFEKGHAVRLEKLPKYMKLPGFVRYPTEYEWEFAVRGGVKTLGHPSFNAVLPFDEQQLYQYAWVQRSKASLKVRPIGKKPPIVLGLHDMIGNVAEYVLGVFRPELWQGKPGGYISKGGSIATKKSNISSAMREEKFNIQWETGKGAHPNLIRIGATGARLAIGSPTTHNGFRKDDLQDAYNVYVKSVRAKLPVGKTSKNPITQTSIAITASQGDLDKIIRLLQPTNPRVANRLKNVKKDLEKAEMMSLQATRESSKTTFVHLISASKNACEAYVREAIATKTIRKLEEIIRTIPGSNLKFKKSLADYKKKLDLIRNKQNEYKAEYADEFKRLMDYEKSIVTETAGFWFSYFDSKGQKNELILLEITNKNIENGFMNNFNLSNWFDTYSHKCSNLNLI